MAQFGDLDRCLEEQRLAAQHLLHDPASPLLRLWLSDQVAEEVLIRAEGKPDQKGPVNLP